MLLSNVELDFFLLKFYVNKKFYFVVLGVEAWHVIALCGMLYYCDQKCCGMLCCCKKMVLRDFSRFFK